GPNQACIGNDTVLCKPVKDSVGVSHKYYGAVGKKAQYQIAVELVVTDGKVAAPVGGQLYLPQTWAEELPRREKAGVPKVMKFQTKPEIAGDLIEETLADGVTAAPVLGDSVYGNAGELRGRIRGL